jgi:hypothetical protein
VSTPTAADVAAAAAVSAAEGVQAATTDGQSVTAMDPLRQLELADKLAARERLAAANPNGGPVSLWGRLRPARVVPPGGV